MANSWQGTTKGPANSKDLEHAEFLNHIKKSLYYSRLPQINCLSLPVTELAAELFSEVKHGYSLEKLDVEEASRISRNACVSPCSLVLALLYIERLKNCNSEYLQQVAPSELFLVSLMVASKFLHDDGEEDEVFNKEWANSGQVTISRMNELEKEFLAAIDWMVFVQQQDFWERLRQLERDVAYREVQKRGWCSYTELSCLINTVQLIAIARTIINVSSICLATYAAGLATLLGSTLVAHFVVQSCLGTTLGSRQPATSADLAEPLINARSQEIESAIPVSLIRDENVVDCLAKSVEADICDDNDAASWQWWLNSMMIWLPEYSTSSESDIEVTNFTDNWCAVNGADFSSDNSSSVAKIGRMEKTGKMEDFAPEDYRRNVNWKETASIWLMQDWRQSHQLRHESFFRLPAKFYY